MSESEVEIFNKVMNEEYCGPWYVDLIEKRDGNLYA